MKIMLVEDDPTARKKISSILSDHGYEVAALASGQQAVAFLESNQRVDIVITEISMPVMNGYDLLSYLKADPQYARIPVVLCSAAPGLERLEPELASDTSRFIAKPVESKALLKAIRAAEEKIRATVLVVDDEKLLRDLLSQILKRDGLRVLTATDGREALDILESNQIALVISDISMPEMDGLELLGNVKERHPRIPVILVTGNVHKFYPDAILKNGADGFIAKPFRNSEILKCVGQLIS